MVPTPDKALGAGLLAALAVLAGALLEGTFTLDVLGVAAGAGIAAGLAVYRIPYQRRRRRQRRTDHRRRP